VSGLLHTFIAERPLPGGGGRGRVDVDDAALALLRFANGAIGALEGTRFATGRKNANRLEINGSRGSLAFDLERLNELELYEEQGASSGFRTLLATDASHPYVAAWWPPGHVLGWEHTFVHTIADFVRALARGEAPSPSFDDGLANQRVLSAIEKSAASRRWESVA
jgi:predicted dehydrogenase